MLINDIIILFWIKITDDSSFCVFKQSYLIHGARCGYYMWLPSLIFFIN